MKKRVLIFSLVFMLLAVIPSFGQNLAANWDGIAVDGGAGTPNSYGWTTTSASLVWQVANGSGNCRYIDYNITGGQTTYKWETSGEAYTSRVLMLRWDLSNDVNAGIFSYPVTLEKDVKYVITFDCASGNGSGGGVPAENAFFNVGVAPNQADTIGMGNVQKQVFTTGVAQTFGSESFSFKSTAAGTFYLKFWKGSTPAQWEWFGLGNLVLEKEKLNLAAGDTLRINFQPAPGVVGGSFPGADIPEGYLGDHGAVFANHGDFSFGWDIDLTSQGRQRLDPAVDGTNPWGNLIQFNRPGTNGVWKILLKPGFYNVLLGAGDAVYTDSDNSFLLNGLSVADPTPYGSTWDTLNVAGVEVLADSILSFTSLAAGNNAKICFIQIKMGEPVTPDTVNVVSVAVDPPTFALIPGAQASLKANVLPVNATIKQVTWSSDDTTVVKVNMSGLVSAIAPGTATITVTSVDGGMVGTSAITVVSANFTGDNLILNPGFEDGTAWWSTWGGFNISNSVEDVASGANAAYVIDGTAGGFAQDVTIPVGGAGKIYIFRVKVRTTGLPTLAQTGCELYEGASKINSPYFVTIENKDTAYTEFVYAVATTPATTIARIWVWKNAPGTIYLDDYSFAEVTDPTGLKPKSEARTFTVYPNPAREYINIGFKSNLGSTQTQISVSDLSGKNIYKTSISGVSVFKLSTADFAKGVYILSILKDGKTSYQKLVIK